jgi:membrane associated rhomboid family serine protease
MLFLWWMGSMLERAIGARRLWITYAVAGVSGGLFTVLVAALAETPVLSWLLPNFASRPHVGASGAVMGVTIAWGIVFADQVMQFFLLGAMKARTFMWILVGIELLVALSWDPTSSSAHFGGMLAGWVIAKDLWRPSHWSEKARRRKLLAERQRIERELRIIEGGKKDDLPN